MLTYQNGRAVPHRYDDGASAFPSQSAGSAGNSIIFAGQSLAFSERLLQVVSEEYPTFDTIHVEDLEQIALLGSDRRAGVQIFIGDESVCRLMLAQKSSWDNHLPFARLVLGYMSVPDATSILSDCRSRGIDLHFLPMTVPIDAWLATLKLVSLGQSFVPAELLQVADGQAPEPAPTSTEVKDVPDARSAPQEPAQPTSPVFRSLTKREKEILGYVSQGERNKSIARRLGLSEHTVKLHVHHIFGKIGVRNRTSATHWYLSQQHLEPEETPE